MDPSDAELEELLLELDKRRRPLLRVTRITTWALLKEVDRLMANSKGWVAVDWESVRKNRPVREAAETRARKRVNQTSLAI